MVDGGAVVVVVDSVVGAVVDDVGSVTVLLVVGWPVVWVVEPPSPVVDDDAFGSVDEVAVSVGRGASGLA